MLEADGQLLMAQGAEYDVHIPQTAPAAGLLKPLRFKVGPLQACGELNF